MAKVPMASVNFAEKLERGIPTWSARRSIVQVDSGLDVTGPELLSFHCAVQAILDFHTASIDVYLAGAKAHGLSEGIAWLINELFVNALEGRHENTTDTIECVLGRSVRNFQAYVDSTSKAGIWT